MKNQRLVLRMSAVTHVGKVYLNGRQVCEHKGGFLPFEAEIGDCVTGGENLLTIAVDNRIDHSTLPVGNEGKSALGGGMFPWKRSKPGNSPNYGFSASSSAITSIPIMLLSVFGIGWILNLVSMKFYPLTKEKMEEIQEEIARIKAREAGVNYKSKCGMQQ